jgi:transcriptional regulator with XRE-family HTH domain
MSITTDPSDFTWAELGWAIRHRRRVKGWSQAEMAAKAGLSQVGVLRIEQGETNPQIASLRGIARALGCTVRELFYGRDEFDEPGDPRLERMARVLNSGDEMAIATLENGLKAAEALLERLGQRRSAAPTRPL